MLISRLSLTNWRNFRKLDLSLGPREFVIGANASGKSNLLDVFRFLRTVARSDGGGLQRAVNERGGMGRLRSLHARSNPEVGIVVEIAEAHGQPAAWRYELAFKVEPSGARRLLVSRERVERLASDGSVAEVLLDRPTPQDTADAVLLTQTALEQIGNNAAFRPVADTFSHVTYLHLVPQLLKFGDQISGRLLEHDPFGQGLLHRIAATPTKSRDARLRRIGRALEIAVPHFSELRFIKDEVTGAPHIEARFAHWRVNGAWHREEHFSDGTLRLIGLLWALQEGDGLLLLEEPEISLNDEIVARLPRMIDRVLRLRKLPSRQVLVSTHSQALLAELGDPRTVIRLTPSPDGTTAGRATEEETALLDAGMNAAEVLLPTTRPANPEQLTMLD